MFGRSVAVALAVLATPLLADPITIETHRGPVEVDRNPATIAVYDVAALDTLAALGVTPAGSVAPVYVDYLDTKGAAPVGTLFEPDYEALAALQPDLVIAGGRSYDAVPDLAKVAPTIDMTIWDDPVTEGLDRLKAYGALFDKTAQAQAKAQEFQSKLDAAKVAVAGQGEALIVMTVGPKISAYGANGRFGWLHTALDLPEAVVDVDSATHGEAISFEFIRQADPDILLVIDRMAAIGQGGEPAQATLDNALVHDTTAWKTGKVIYLDSAPLYIAGGGIQSMSIILDQITAALADS